MPARSVLVTLASARTSEDRESAECPSIRNTLDNVTRMTGWMRRLRTNSSLENALAALAATDEANGQKHGRQSVESMDDHHLDALTNLATEGDRGAQYRLACNYSETPDMEADAFSWMSKAADQGMPNAVSKLALFYYHGYGTEQDSRRAFELAELAAEGSVAEALGLLGMMHMLGDEEHNIPQDHKRHIISRAEAPFSETASPSVHSPSFTAKVWDVTKIVNLRFTGSRKPQPVTTCSNTTRNTSLVCGTGKVNTSKKIIPQV